ncbi:hypothetical protein PG991_012206 [Apiospora marii]|uniref:Uncharacterized protein n=1 Tax=Apiospora marii TaxID=335849 RepID=A0ABR1R922_9PEZI
MHQPTNSEPSPNRGEASALAGKSRAAAEARLRGQSDAIFGREKFGFVLCRTSELPSALEDYLLKECNTPASRKKLIEDSPFLKTFRLLWKRFLKQSIFGDYRDGEGELEIMHQALTGAASGRHPAERLTLCYQSPFLAPETAEGAAAFRAEHRRRRALPPDGKAYGWDRRLHPRYFLVMDKAGFPPVDAVVFTNRVALPEVWVYDADWAPFGAC